jgi:hypothetical protein
VPFSEPFFDTPQIQPSPETEFGCRASTSHPAGIVTALADGSVRTVPGSISKQTWGYALNPRDGAVLGPDW